MNAAPAEVLAARARAEELVSAAEIRKAVDQVAVRMTVDLAQSNPVLISVLEGGLAFTGWLLKRLPFPLQTAYVHVGRYGDETSGGQLRWHAKPTINLQDRCVIFIDDILDQGITLKHLREWALAEGATEVKVAVLVDKQIPDARFRPIEADYIGLQAPDRFLFGCGMDYRGSWRNLPAVYALAADG